MAQPTKQSRAAMQVFERRRAGAESVVEQYRPQWRSMYRAYRALASGHMPEKEDWQTELLTPYIYQILESALPRYIDPDPSVLFKPLHPMYRDNTLAAQHVVNDQLDAMDYATKQLDVLTPAGVFGQSWAKAVWHKDVRMRTRRNTLEAIAGGAPVKVQRPETFFDGPIMQVRSLFNMLPEPGTQGMEECGWIIERSTTTMNRLRRQEKRQKKSGEWVGIYENLDSVPRGKPQLGDEDGLPNLTADERDAFKLGADVLLYEMWEPTANRAMTIANGVVIRDSEYPWDHGMFPYICLTLRKDIYSFHGISPVEMMMPTQGQLHIADAQRIDNARLAADAVMGYTEAVENPDDLLVHPGAKWGPMHEGDVFPIEFPNTQGISLQESTVMKADLQAIGGVQPDIAGAGSDASSDSERPVGTELAVQRERNKRTLLGLLNVNVQMTQRLGQLCHELNEQFLDGEVYVATNDEEMVRYTPEQRTGRFRVQVRAADDDVVKQLRFTNNVSLLNTMSNWAGQAGPDGKLFNPGPILKDIALTQNWNPDDIWTPAPPKDPNAGVSLRKEDLESVAGNYKDFPEDIRRQWEQAQGFQPSQMGGDSVSDAAASAPRALVTQMANRQASAPQQAPAPQAPPAMPMGQPGA